MNTADHDRSAEDELAPPPPPPARTSPDEPWRVLVVPLVSLIAIAIYLLLSQGNKAPLPPPTGEYVPIRVLLVRSAPQIQLGLAGDWVVIPREGSGEPMALKDLGAAVLNGHTWALEGSGPGIPLPACDEISIEPLNPAPGPMPILGLEERRYRGKLWIRRLPGGLLRVINTVELEDYLAGVIGHEMPLRWHDEAVKAQAIAARTYAMRELRPTRAYDLESDTRSQVYRGVMSDDDRAQAMVRATQGLVVKHNGRMVTTYFHSTCGGDTIPASWVFTQVKVDTEPLSGATDCTCQPSKFYRWEKQVDLRSISQLKVALPLRELRIEHWPRGGYVKQVVFVGANGLEQRWQGYREARSYLGLRAPAFDGELLAGGTEVMFRGRGWGHGVGMCQYGAKGFAEKGLSAGQIMTHFYPGTKVLPITPADLE